MADSRRSQKIEQLQEQVNQRVRDAVAELQRELRERLRRAGDQIVGEMDRELESGAPPLPDSFLSGDELEPLAEEAGDTARREAVSMLVSALAAVDRADSQAAILATLCREATRFAGRSALFLARADDLELWGSAGWDESMEGTRVAYADAGSWSRSSLGSGTAELTTGDCGALCSLVDAPLPHAGALVPLVLRDRLAAVLYADHGEGEDLLVEALQALTYAGALALETLPFRQRAATPTLSRAAGGGPALDVWTAAAGAPAAEAAAEEAPAEEAPEEAPEDAAPAEEPPGEEAEEPSWEQEPAAEEPEGGGEAEIAAAEAGFDLAEEGAEPAAEAGEGEEPEDLYTGGDDLYAGEEDSSTVRTPSATPTSTPTSTAATTKRTRAPSTSRSRKRRRSPSLTEPAQPEAWTDEEDGGEPQAEPATGFEAPAAFEAPVAVEAPPAEVEPPQAVAEDETADLTPPAPLVPEPPPEPPVPAPPPAAGSSQVAAPSDVEGPGRAFGAAEPSSDEEARHEEARRLARLLVSEIRLYNEEEVDEGRRHNDVYARLKEDIDRSRQMYEERVDPAIRETTDYFYQELVRNLGGGDEKALGI